MCCRHTFTQYSTSTHTHTRVYIKKIRARDILLRASHRKHNREKNACHFGAFMNLICRNGEYYGGYMCSPYLDVPFFDHKGEII